MGRDIAEMRRSYKLGNLGKGDLAADPFDQFRLWFAHATDAGIPEPNAMILSTVSRQGSPSSRIILLKDIGQEGISFYTNYESRKGMEISDNPNVALLFPWIMLERQVRVEGVASKVSDEESDAYFTSRPTGSRLGAWASRQSSVIPSREVLESSLKEHLMTFGNNIPRPPYWGGYRVKPLLFEFWQGREDRLHDRFTYTLTDSGGWKTDRLSP